MISSCCNIAERKDSNGLRFFIDDVIRIAFEKDDCIKIRIPMPLPGVWLRDRECKLIVDDMRGRNKIEIFGWNGKQRTFFNQVRLFLIHIAEYSTAFAFDFFNIELRFTHCLFVGKCTGEGSLHLSIIVDVVISSVIGCNKNSSSYLL